MSKIYGNIIKPITKTEGPVLPTYVFYFGNRYEVVPVWGVSGTAYSTYQEVGVVVPAQAGGYVVSNNKVDITKYSKLTVEFRNAFNGYNNGTLTFQILNSAGTTVKSVANAFVRTGESGGGTVTYDIDISTLVGEHSFRLYISGQNTQGMSYALIRRIELYI